MKTLTPMQIDALTEIINIGIGRAASSLSEIIGSHILLNVPQLELLPFDELPRLADKLGSSPVSSITQGFSGDFAGSAALLFPPESAVRLVSLLTGEEISQSVLDTLRSGTLMEIGNIVINAILGTIGNILACRLHFSLPQYHDRNLVTELVEPDIRRECRGFILLAEANFVIKTLAISGFIILIFRIDSMESLITAIEKVIRDGTHDEH